MGEHLRSAEIARDICVAHPTVQLLFASDSMGTRGAHAALRDLPSIRIVGVAQDSDLRQFVAAGLIDSLIVQAPYAMGQLAVEMLGNLFAGRSIGKAHVETEIALATKENVQSPQILRLVDRRRMEAAR